ncbi:UNVERIFIED_CONTAM: Enzymatic polyprotein [Sesamum latifolium]|uniref:Enzymatic polyprotein n=1 Tax=Sesamum latifolium TaxID=2727402 RepID=A0AAW2UF95_9LAMI
MTVSNKIMERIRCQDSNLSPYDGFRIGGIGRVLNQIGLNQRKHHIIYKVSLGEFAIPMELTGNVMEMQLIPKEEILEELSKLREEVAVTMKWIHIGAIEVVIKATFKEEIDSEIHLSIMYRRINNLRDGYLGTMIGSGICTAKPGVFPTEAMETLPVIAGRDFSQKILILNKGIREAKIMIGGAFRTTWFRDNKRNLLIFTTNCGSEIQVLQREKAFNRIMPINFRSKCGDFDAKLIHSKMQDKRKFGKALLSFRQQGLIESDSFYKESKKEIINLKEALQEIKLLDISKESRLSLENVKRLIQRNFSENPLVWWDRNKIEATLKVKEECKYEYVRYKPIQMNMEDKKDIEGLVLSEKKATITVNKIEFLGILIDETGIELQDHIVEKIRNFSDVLKDKKHLQSFLGVVNFAGIFIKDLAKYRKNFRPLLKETESSKWKWEEIHTQRVRELKQVCSNLPKLAIPQDEDELVVYTDANDY